MTSSHFLLRLSSARAELDAIAARLRESADYKHGDRTAAHLYGLAPAVDDPPVRERRDE